MGWYAGWRALRVNTMTATVSEVVMTGISAMWVAITARRTVATATSGWVSRGISSSAPSVHMPSWLG